jgi:CBS domain-containing protein
MFRTLGLRHLCVVNRHHQVRGIVTRADLVTAKEGRQDSDHNMSENIPKGHVSPAPLRTTPIEYNERELGRRKLSIRRLDSIPSSENLWLDEDGNTVNATM